MIFDSARLALVNLLSPEARAAFWKILGLTVLILIAAWILLREVFIIVALPWLQAFIPDLPDWAGWLGFVIAIFMSLGLALALALLVAPVTALVAGVFLDDVADVIEKRDYPAEPAGTAMPLGAAMLASLKFLGVVILGNIVAFLLLLIPGVNIIAFFLVNGYLLGREFFEFAAMRYRSPQEAREFRARNGAIVFTAGLVIAAFLAIPLVNLLTPLFAAAFMVHLHKKLSQREMLVSG